MRLGLVITLACSTFLSLALSAVVSAESEEFLIQPYSATYKGTINGSKIGSEGVRSLEQIAPGHFRLKTEAKSFLFDVTEQAEFKIIDGNFQSLVYSSKRDTVVTSRHKDVRFDWETMQAHYNYKDRKGKFQLKPKTSDPLTTELVIAHHLQSGAPEKSITIPESDDRRLKIRQFEIRGKELIEIPYGKLDTVKVELVDDKKRDRQTLLWYAPSLNYLLVRVQQIKEDDVFELALKSYSPKSKPVVFAKPKSVGHKSADKIDQTMEPPSVTPPVNDISDATALTPDLNQAAPYIATPKAPTLPNGTQAKSTDKTQTSHQQKPETAQKPDSKITPQQTTSSTPQATSTNDADVAKTIPKTVEDNQFKVAEKAISKAEDAAEIIDLEASWNCDNRKSPNKSD